MCKRSLIALTLMVVSTLTFAGEGTVESAEKSCIPIRSIDKLTVLDKERILFEMHGTRYYLNTLPHSCPGMRKDKPIMYKTSLSQLCNVDIVTVLENFGGGFYPSSSCGLGKFTEISKDEAKNLAARKD